MKLHCISKSCFVLRFKDECILLDTPVDFSCLKCDTEEETICIPELSAYDMANVDAIFVSNHQTILALPYITEHTDFTGHVYCTEPTLQDGKLLMEEIISQFQLRFPSSFRIHNINDEDSFWVEYFSYRKLFSKKDVAQCLSKVECISFGQDVAVSGNISVRAVSSGFSFGSANWIVKSISGKMSFVGSSSGSSTRCPKSMEVAALCNSDVIVFSDFQNESAGAVPDKALRSLCNSLQNTISHGGSVLIPCLSFGLIWDLLSHISSHLERLGDKKTVMYIVSSCASRIISQQSVHTEWASASTNGIVSSTIRELTEIGRLRVVDDIDEVPIATPCVVFTGHPCLRFGHVLHFISKWGSDPKNTLLLAEPKYVTEEIMCLLRDEINLKMNVVSCQVDVRLHMTDIDVLISKLCPKCVLIPAQHYSLKVPGDGVRVSTRIVKYSVFDVLDLPLECRYETYSLESQLANAVEMKKVPDMAAPVFASMVEAALSKNAAKHSVVQYSNADTQVHTIDSRKQKQRR